MLDKWYQIKANIEAVRVIKNISPKIIDEFIEDLKKIQNLLDKYDIKWL